MRLLDRYVLRHFLQAYFYCIAGFISIWFIFDVSDNISTFLDQRISRVLIAKYYLTQVPQILVILLPVALLLGVAFLSGPDVALERNRLHADRRGEFAARRRAPSPRRVAHDRGEHGSELFARPPRRTMRTKNSWKIRNHAASRSV